MQLWSKVRIIFKAKNLKQSSIIIYFLCFSASGPIHTNTKKYDPDSLWRNLMWSSIFCLSTYELKTITIDACAVFLHTSMNIFINESFKQSLNEDSMNGFLGQTPCGPHISFSPFNRHVVQYRFWQWRTESMGLQSSNFSHYPLRRQEKSYFFVL